MGFREEEEGHLLRAICVLEKEQSAALAPPRSSGLAGTQDAKAGQFQADVVSWDKGELAGCASREEYLGGGDVRKQEWGSLTLFY